eukprot:g9794.t1
MLSPSTSLQYLHLSEQSTSASEPDAEALAAASHTAEALGCGALKAVKCDSCGSEEVVKGRSFAERGQKYCQERANELSTNGSRGDAYFLPSFLCDAEDESVMAALQLELETEGKVMSDWHGARHLGLQFEKGLEPGEESLRAKLADRLVKKCLEDPKLAERRDLLALFLQGNFSPQFTKQMVLHLIIAGRDTTACLLSWTFYELTRNPEIQKRLHEEIMQKHPKGSVPDWKSLSASEMPYLNGVLYEALRLWPPVPSDPKMAYEDDVLPGGWAVPKYAKVLFSPYNMGRDPERYPEPLDFRPERWIPFTPRWKQRDDETAEPHTPRKVFQPVEPKVIEVYAHKPGDRPRKARGDRRVIGHLHFWLQLDDFNNIEYDIRTPEQWLELGQQPDGSFLPLQADAMRFHETKGSVWEEGASTVAWPVRAGRVSHVLLLGRALPCTPRRVDLQRSGRLAIWAMASAGYATTRAPGSNGKFKIGLCQCVLGHDKKVKKGAEVVVLGEMFSCPYATKYFFEYGERLPLPGQLASDSSPSVKLLCEMAREHKVWIFGGSLPELEGDKVYNTTLVLNPEGGIAPWAKDLKKNPCDPCDVFTFGAPCGLESDVLSVGESMTLVDLPWCRVGVGICYDSRFPELALAMRAEGAKVLVYPGAFNMTTGPAHYQLLARGRAVDTQSYVVFCSPSRSPDKNDYQAWGHSQLINPWAEIVVEAEHEPGVWVVEVDPSEADRIREQVPTSYQKRGDLYAPYAELEDVKRRRGDSSL